MMSLIHPEFIKLWMRAKVTTYYGTVRGYRAAASVYHLPYGMITRKSTYVSRKYVQKFKATVYHENEHHQHMSASLFTRY